ncbi:hypothetical protein RchiOBHm_Chr6g0271501 [Rosa chinensis]|uniref:Uncharacterized protein n=1 Tax=Rosa chinensis TaxID=74649 RepID=A0A2P6PQY4_ROSCH|nr:hypothetical protein RchiOBHm_Chr6g0271501 [Rosa chinensis]
MTVKRSSDVSWCEHRKGRVTPGYHQGGDDPVLYVGEDRSEIRDSRRTVTRLKVCELHSVFLCAF